MLADPVRDDRHVKAPDTMGGVPGEMIVVPREVDDPVNDIAPVLSDGINRALRPGLSPQDIALMRE